MGRKSSKSTNIVFEDSDQLDSLMENIFDKIEDIPDKENVLEISVKKSSLKKRSTKDKRFINPDQELDLHGKNREEAIIKVQNFIMTCLANEVKTALIITGKGHNSGNQGPVLKREVRLWLENNAKNYLFEFYDAPPRFGGLGAIWINFK